MVTKPEKQRHKQARRADGRGAVMPPRLLSLREVMALTGVSRDTIYRWGRLKKFPRHLRIGMRCSRWREDEILAWMVAAATTRDQAA